MKYLLRFSINLLLFNNFQLIQMCEEYNKTYNPPSNKKFPFGDENEMNSDVTLNDTNTIVCYDKKEYVPEYGRCPFPPADPNDIIQSNPYVLCPNFPEIPGQMVIHEEDTSSSPNALCQNCDVQLTPDGNAVNLKCYSCYDLANEQYWANLTEQELIYTTYYVEISNYTSLKKIQF
ncbi:hypothetical protein ABEB36_000496 [Hypothenemus hampei]|uniref:Uncharacterized protein n=1 Tax=Hypothenemus hampei TaxID=57062 RepID=A0ABD1FC02_HYPHA